jgi:hypothetical protein
MHDLEQSFAAKGIRRGGVLMLSAPDALAFIEAARGQQTPVLGVESFIVTETTTQPLMKHILNLAAPPRSAGPLTKYQQANRRCSEPGHRAPDAIHASLVGRVAELGSLGGLVRIR